MLICSISLFDHNTSYLSFTGRAYELISSACCDGVFRVISTRIDGIAMYRMVSRSRGDAIQNDCPGRRPVGCCLISGRLMRLNCDVFGVGSEATICTTLYCPCLAQVLVWI